jgi:hypothetical protein
MTQLPFHLEEDNARDALLAEQLEAFDELLEQDRVFQAHRQRKYDSTWINMTDLEAYEDEQRRFIMRRRFLFLQRTYAKFYKGARLLAIPGSARWHRNVFQDFELLSYGRQSATVYGDAVESPTSSEASVSMADVNLTQSGNALDDVSESNYWTLAAAMRSDTAAADAEDSFRAVVEQQCPPPLVDFVVQSARGRLQPADDGAASYWTLAAAMRDNLDTDDGLLTEGTLRATLGPHCSAPLVDFVVRSVAAVDPDTTENGVKPTAEASDARRSDAPPDDRAATAEADRLAAVEVKRTGAVEADRVAAMEAERLAAIEVDRVAAIEAERLAAIEADRIAAIDAQRLAVIEADRLAASEAERLAAIEGDRVAAIEVGRVATIEAERLAAIEVDRVAAIEADRIAAIEADRIAAVEAERLAAIEADRIAAMEAERRAAIEADRCAATEADRPGAIEADRLAAIEADRIESERLATAAAERVAHVEAERPAAIEAERVSAMQAERLCAITDERLAAVQGEGVAPIEAPRLAATDGQRLGAVATEDGAYAGVSGGNAVDATAPDASSNGGLAGNCEGEGGEHGCAADGAGARVAAHGAQRGSGRCDAAGVATVAEHMPSGAAAATHTGGTANGKALLDECKSDLSASVARVAERIAETVPHTAASAEELCGGAEEEPRTSTQRFAHVTLEVSQASGLRVPRQRSFCCMLLGSKKSGRVHTVVRYRGRGGDGVATSPAVPSNRCPYWNWSAALVVDCGGPPMAIEVWHTARGSHELLGTAALVASPSQDTTTQVLRLSQQVVPEHRDAVCAVNNDSLPVMTVVGGSVVFDTKNSPARATIIGDVHVRYRSSGPK